MNGGRGCRAGACGDQRSGRGVDRQRRVLKQCDRVTGPSNDRLATRSRGLNAEHAYLNNSGELRERAARLAGTAATPKQDIVVGDSRRQLCMAPRPSDCFQNFGRLNRCWREFDGQVDAGRSVVSVAGQVALGKKKSAIPVYVIHPTSRQIRHGDTCLHYIESQTSYRSQTGRAATSQRVNGVLAQLHRSAFVTDADPLTRQCLPILVLFREAYCSGMPLQGTTKSETPRTRHYRHLVARGGSTLLRHHVRPKKVFADRSKVPRYLATPRARVLPTPSHVP